jgi:PilZ domain
MQYYADPAETGSVEPGSIERGSGVRRRRRHPRCPLRSLSYVRLDQGNGGIIRDLTESGIAIQAVGRLHPEQHIRVAFDLLSPRVRVETMGRVAWSDVNGQGGIEFSELPLRTRRALRDWLLMQMLSSAAVTGRDSMFHSPEPQLVTSAASRPAIILPEAPPQAEKARVRWGLISLSARVFASFLDCVILSCAILLFGVSSLAVMGAMPAWPLAAAFFTTASIIFVAVYSLLFSDWICRATPGRRLAALAAGQSVAEPTARFR